MMLSGINACVRLALFILVNLHTRILPSQLNRHISWIDQITKVTSTDFDAIQNGHDEWSYAIKMLFAYNISLDINVKNIL